MKKTFLILVISVFFIGVINAASITVDKPNASTTWYIGDTYTIYWTAKGEMDGFVRIRLKEKDCGAVKVIIVNNTDNDGKYYPFTIPATVQPGQYSIIVRTMDGLTWGCSKNFTIDNKIKPGKSEVKLKKSEISVSKKPSFINPKGGEWIIRGTMKIQWTSMGIRSKWKLRLNQNGNPIGLIKKGIVPNVLLHEWRVGELGRKWAKPGDNFSIQLVYKIGDQIHRIDSAPFSIRIRPMLKAYPIVIKRPNINSKWRTGAIHIIKWRTKLKQPFIIQLYDSTGQIYRDAIGQFNPLERVDYAGKYTFKWDIALAYKWAPGDYTIRISTLDNKVAGLSERFTLLKAFSTNLKSKSVSQSGDTDKDGMPNVWEIQFGLNPNDAQDATKDVDNDGLNNLNEYQYGTNPTNPDSDGGGQLDGSEVKAGLDPLDPSDDHGLPTPAGSS